ncbi:hypothetical protein ABGT16_05160 [Pseudomonas asiatica]|uniref:hypothetical protein n=1 Tax=Pseudomonas asiatica TaxID=2219225 RepID=UPI00345D107F
MLNLITDQLGDEPDVLTPLKHAAFEIRSLAGKVLMTIAAPSAGWTHEELVAVVAKYATVTHDGAEGFLDNQWVGSTEI